MVRYVFKTPFGVYYSDWDDDHTAKQLIDYMTSSLNLDNLTSITVYGDGGTAAIITGEVLKQSIIEVEQYTTE